jgi:hypothetical protein
MALKLSQGVRDGLLLTGSFKALMDGGKVRIFTGAAPASPNDAESGTLLVTIQSDDVGDNLCDFDAVLPAAGQIEKESTQVWSANAVATGTAGYFRYVANPADAGGSSTTEERLQGNVGTSGSDLNMSSVNIVSGAPQTIDTFKVTIPES